MEDLGFDESFLSQVRDQGNEDQNSSGPVIGTYLAKFDDVIGFTFPYIYERHLGFYEPFLSDVDSREDIIARADPLWVKIDRVSATLVN